jgi:hypothetical protein
MSTPRIIKVGETAGKLARSATYVNSDDDDCTSALAILEDVRTKTNATLNAFNETFKQIEQNIKTYKTLLDQVGHVSIDVLFQNKNEQLYSCDISCFEILEDTILTELLDLLTDRLAKQFYYEYTFHKAIQKEQEKEDVRGALFFLSILFTGFTVFKLSRYWAASQE